MSAAPKVRMPRIIRQLEYGLVIVAVVFLGQLLFVSMRLHETENRPTVNSEKDLSKVLYMDDIVKKAELSASAKAAPLQGGTAEATGSDKSFVKGQKKESQSLQLPAAKASKSVKEDVKRTKKKHRRRKRNSWDPGTQGLKGDPISLKINLPVFVPSLPKSGTTSIWQYFNCGGHQASHQWVKVNDTASTQSGQCIQRNVERGRPPFEGCGTYEIYTDTGFANIDATGPSCYYPSVDALDAIYDSYPNATFVMVVRNTSSWFNSMESWGEGSLLKRWAGCNTTGFGWTMEREKIEQFYDWHTENIRQFARNHPSINYIEVELESPETGRILEEKIGIPSKCWAKCTPYSKFCEPAS